MEVSAFIRARRPRWERLLTLLDRVDARGLEQLSAAEVDELFTLYRHTSSDLNLMQTRTGNPAVLESLEGLVGRAYTLLAVDRRVALWRRWWRCVRHEFPACIRASRTAVLAAAGVMLSGALLGFCITLVEPAAAEVFVPAEHFDERPSERVHRLETDPDSENQQLGTQPGGMASFAAFLFTHNIRVAIFCFALGFTWGIGTVVLLFFNGGMLGALAALYQVDGEMEFFVAWVGPHGALELPCIVFAGAAGLLIAEAQLRRDRGTLRQQLRALRRRLMTLVVGTATLLVCAGLIEGSFSQINEPILPYPLKITVAATLFASLLGYLIYMPVRPSNPAAAAQDELLAPELRPVAAT